MPKPNYAQIQNSLPLVIIDEGKFDDTNLSRTEKSREYFLDVLKKQGCEDLKKVLVLTVDGDGNAYLQKKGEKYKTFSLGFEKSLW